MTKLKKEVELGAKYNNWTIISTEKYKLYGTQTGVLVQCDCGAKKIISATYLFGKRGNGCMNCRVQRQTVDVKIGSTYGDWTVLSLDKDPTKVIARCKCGKDTILVKYYLINKRTKSCVDCSNKNKFQGIGDLSLGYFTQTLQGAKKRNLEFTVTIQELWDLFLKQCGKCALSGDLITLSKCKSKIKQTASLDRINSKKGYVIDNVQWVHKDVNRMKMDINEDEFIKLCKQVVNHKNKKNEI